MERSPKAEQALEAANAMTAGEQAAAQEAMQKRNALQRRFMEIFLADGGTFDEWTNTCAGVFGTWYDHYDGGDVSDSEIEALLVAFKNHQDSKDQAA